MRVLLTAVLLLAFAPAAQAERHWLDPVPVASTYGAVTGDGTLVIGWTDASGLHVRIGDKPAQIVGPPYTYGRLVVAGNALAVLWDTGEGVYATFGSVDGDFQAPVVIGAAPLQEVAGGRDGDMAFLTGGNELRYRSAAGTLGSPAIVPSPVARRSPVYSFSGALSLGTGGEQLIAFPTGDSMRVMSRVGDGGFSPPQTIGSTDGFPTPGIAIDASGRALVAWDGDGRTAALRDEHGTWHSLDAFGPGHHGFTSIGTSAAGDGAVLYLSSGKWWAAPLSLATGTLGAAAGYELSAPSAYRPGAGLVVGEDGEAAVVLQDGRVVAVARRGSDGFGPPEVAGCKSLNGTAHAPGFSGQDILLLLDAFPAATPSLIRDADGPGVIRTCPQPEAPHGAMTATYDPEPALAGRPVTIRVANLRLPDAALTSARWDFGDQVLTSPGDSITRTFSAPGVHDWTVIADEVRDGIFQSAVFNGRVAVYAPAALTPVAPSSRRTKVRFHANAFAFGPKVPVTLVVRRGGKVRWRVALALGAAPERVDLQLRHRGRYTVSLVQDGQTRARATVVRS